MIFFFSSRRRHTRLQGDWSSDVCSSDLLDVIVQTAKSADGRSRALEILWVDKILGGSGIIEAMVREFQQVARAAVRHLEGHDCPASCYRCLRSYRNQRIHGILNWRLAMPYLQAAAASELEPLVSTMPPSRGGGPEWDEARREGCESPLELRLLKAIRSAGLPEPVKQHEVYDSRGRLLTRADFAYVTPKRICRRRGPKCMVAKRNLLWSTGSHLTS